MGLVREDLKNNPKYLNEVIHVMGSSITELRKQVSKLNDERITDEQLQVELNDKIKMLNRHFFAKSNESLNKSRPSSRSDQILLPHNTPPIEVSSEKASTISKVEITHTENHCPCCNGELEEMKGQSEDSTEIDLRDKKAISKKHKRQKYRCKSCDKIITAKGTAKLKPGSKYSIPFAVAVAVDKYSYHLPLERQRRLFEEQGLKIDTKTLYTLSESLFLNLEEIASKIRKEIKDYGYIHLDETRGKLLSTNTNGFIWSMGNKYGAYFQYETTRSGKVASEMLGDFKGTIINDGFSGYNRFKNEKGMSVAHCWAHARRKFFDALSNYPEAEEVIRLIDKLFRIDRKSKACFKRLQKLRQKHSVPTIEAIYNELHHLWNQTLPRSGLGKAIAYTFNHWDGLTKFMADPKIPLSNNLAERVLRNPVKGRDNYNGYRSINGADTAMFFYTVIETCKMLKINPRAYLIAQSERKWEELTLQSPLEWAKA